ncbi:kinase-like domain-containing protein [Ampelomyces quisqualis]|uniref:Kinase-like domain-containing protein n=1 Tax=Ampelomyces quisqualis TaxID=50730 RepID=A0A6A5QIW6_AMPQU|nr:kinase-like domain-containing protein [Ampelomyces quisqualis]
MGHGGTFLLDNDDELYISESVSLVFNSLQPIGEAQFTPIQKREKAIFAEDYLITSRLLGQGGYGVVLIGVDQATQRQLACKIIRLDHLYEKPHIPNLRLPTGPHEQKAQVGKKRWPTRVAACFREFDILKELSHPNIVGIEKVFWSNNTIYLFQELVTGGDLFSFLEYKGGRLDNALAVVIVRQVLLGIEYLHAQGIVHRDLKPDNILMASLEDGARVVITDFGNARFLPDAKHVSTERSARCQRMFSTVGTLEYAAPEIHRMNPTIPAGEGYSKSIDMWSIGSITAALLSGEAIFTNRAHPQYYDNPRFVIVSLAAQCDLSILDEDYHPVWGQVEQLPKDFIKRLLVLEEDERMTASGALAHMWLANDCYVDDLEDLYARSIRGWQPRSASSQLVERISQRLPDLTAVGLPGQAMNQDTVSRYFHASEQQMTQSIMQTLSTSKHRCARTSLPSITDDYANRNFQFASEIAPSSFDTNNADSPHEADRASSRIQPRQQRVSRQSETAQHGEYELDNSGNASAQASDVNVERQHAKCELAASGEYSTARGDEQSESYGSTESLNNVMDVAYSQHPVRLHAPNAQRQDSSEQNFVQEIHAEADAGLTAEESYQHTQYQEEYREHYMPDEEQASVLVYETPPEGLAHH